jgi:hypothetical protein
MSASTKAFFQKPFKISGFVKCDSNLEGVLKGTQIVILIKKEMSPNLRPKL